ncbi:hypothetical protein RQP46_004536 [Phenoliferia psychrophenolica]
MPLLSNADFLTQLQALFSAKQAKGAVFLTQKRLSYESPADDAVMQEASGSDEREWPCLLRATGGSQDKKTKLSTIVQPADYAAFTASYGTVLKGAMTSLRKKRKQKRKPEGKKAAPGAAAGGARATFVPTLPKVVGPRRGAGKAMRDRAEKRRARELAKLEARGKRSKLI